MRRCEDATRICVLHLSNNWSGKGKGSGRRQGKCLGCCSSATRHSKTLASYDNLSYPSVEEHFQIQIQIEMCVSVVDAFVARGPSCHKQQQNCYEVCRFVSQIAIPLLSPLWGRISVGLCTYLTIIIANHFTLLRLMPLGTGRQGPWDIKAPSLSPSLSLLLFVECVWCVWFTDLVLDFDFDLN